VEQAGQRCGGVGMDFVHVKTVKFSLRCRKRRFWGTHATRALNLGEGFQIKGEREHSARSFRHSAGMSESAKCAG
jgi:hypothetical protein